MKFSKRATNLIFPSKKRRNKFFILTVLFVFSIFSVQAQETWEKTVKNAGGVILEQSQKVEIEINAEGKLEINSRVYEETEHLAENTGIFGEQSVGYSGSFSEVSDLEAYTLIPTEKNKFKKITVEDFVTTDSRSAGVFYDDQKEINFLFPALTAGSKTVISYSKKFNEPRLWGYFVFSSFFPVQKSIYSVKVPLDVKIKYTVYGEEDGDIQFSLDKKGKYNVYTWTATQLDRIRIGKGSEGILHTAPHLVIHVDSYTFEGKEYRVLGDVNDLHDWYQSFIADREGEENPEIKQLVDSILVGKSDELDKVETIYDWVQNNIKYIAIEDGLGGFRPRSSSVVFNRRYGDCKDMSNLIHTMLGTAGISSDLTWIGTTAIPYSHTQVPTPMADNHMICTYIHDGKYYFLDATDPYNILGVPTTHIQGREALINKGVKDFDLVNVPVVPADKNFVIDSVFLQIENDMIHGSGEVIFSGYKKSPIVNNLQNLNEKDKKLFLNGLLSKGNNKFMLDSVSTLYVSDKQHDLEIDYDFTIGDYIGKFEDEIFFNPHLNKALQNGLIDLEKEQEEIHYPYKNMTTEMYCFQIPEGFNINYLPKDVSFENDDFGFSLSYQTKSDYIMVKQQVVINTMKLRTDQFEVWNEMVKSLFAAYKESIVLVRD